jgi:phospholipid N-methyltransferase
MIKDKKNVKELVSVSKFLIREIVHYIGKMDSPLKILEVCPSNYAITEAILDKMDNSDSLTIFIMNRECRKKLNPSVFDGKNVSIVHKNLDELPDTNRFDYIVMDSSINSLTPPIVAELMSKLLNSLSKNGILAYYEYTNLGVNNTILNIEKKKKHRMLKKLVNNLINNYEFKRERVILNFPPIYVHYLHNRK